MIDRLERRLHDMEATSERLTRWRLGAFLAGLGGVLAGLAVNNMLAALILAVWLVGFGVLVYHHRRVQTEIDRFRVWLEIKRAHRARRTLDWDNLPQEAVEPPGDHPFVIDLDIIGRHSIHRLLDVSVSLGGSQRLKDWLLIQSPDLDFIRKQQTLVAELKTIPMFRDKLALNALLASRRRDKNQKWDATRLLNWLRAEDGIPTISGGLVAGLGVLAAFNLVALLAYLAGIIPPVWMVTFVIFIMISGLQWRNMAGLFSAAMSAQSQLERLQAVFRYLETYGYPDRPALRDLCAPFTDAKERPSAMLRRLKVITAAASLQRNPILWLALNLLSPWDIFFAYLLGRSKGALNAVLPRWLDVWYELEALNSLATFADLNRGYTFPQVTPGALLEGVQLGHPLIPKDEKVRNDFAMDELGEAVIITGSNMSGKSSFLRTLGVNLVLAYAGGVTDAAHLETGLFRVFTSIRVSDSVVDGFSYFYAEVRRLKALLTALEADDTYPLFFLIDEIFRGTNNRERLIGSRSYIKALVGKRGMGLISTHDLELVNLADEIKQVVNYHFREDVIDGKMVFDYTLRPGPSPTTNALKIMRVEGLPVETAQEI